MTVTKTACFKTGMLSASAMAIALSLIACQAKPDLVAQPEAAPTAKVGDEASKEIPADLYKGMPIYPGAVVVHVGQPDSGSANEPNSQ